MKTLRPSLRLTAAAAVGALTLGLAGCGYSQSDPEKAVQAMIDALVDGDAEKVCDWTLGADGEPVTGEERTVCLASADVDLDEDAREQYDRMIANGAEVTTDGDEATLVYRVNDDTDWTVKMKRIEGRWYFVESVS